MKMNREHNFTGIRKSWLAKYTLLYLIVALPLAVYFAASGRTLIFSGDGFYQHYTILAYVRDTIRGLLNGNGFAMVDYHLGQGLDSITTLASHGFLSPFYLIAVFFSDERLDVAYGLITLLQFYTAGFTFGIFLNQFEMMRKSSGWAIAAAGMMYAFCGYNLVSVMQHPYFVDGAVFLALMLTGIERLLQRRKWSMLSFVTMIMLVSNYYFAYKTAILSALYILIRILPHLRREYGGIQRVLREGFSLLGACCLGVALSAVVLLPIGLAFIGSSRTGVSGGYSGSILHYGMQYYVKLLTRFCSPASNIGYWAFAGFCPPALLAILDLFLNNRDHASIESLQSRARTRVAMVITGIFLCVPAVGKVFNGFSYVSNRWSYGFAFAVCVVAALWMLHLEKDALPVRKRVWIAGLLQAACAAGVGILSGNHSVLLGAAATGFFVLFVAFFGNRRMHAKPMVRILAVLSAGCCALYSIVAMVPNDKFSYSGVDRQVKSVPAGQIELPEDGFYRLDTGVEPDNHSIFLDYYGTSYYWSVIPAHVSEYYQDLHMGTLAFSYRLNSLGADSTLLALSGAKYGVRDAEQPAVMLPYGAQKQNSSENAVLYLNPHAMDLGYAFHSKIPESEYHKMDPMEKRLALLSGAVIPDDVNVNLPEFKGGELTCPELSWKLKAEDGAVLEEHTLTGRAGDSVTLEFECVPGAETYLLMDETLATYAPDGQVAVLDFETENGFNRAGIVKKESNFYYEQQGICINLGCFDTETARVTLRFVQDGILKFNQISLRVMPEDVFCERTASLQREMLTDVEIGRNCVSGRVMLENDGVLQISIPYSEGWTAKVNGQTAELIRCGGMYMGLALESGAYEIEMNYCTPGLKPGFAISLVSALTMLVLCVGSRMQRKKT